MKFGNINIYLAAFFCLLFLHTWGITKDEVVEKKEPLVISISAHGAKGDGLTINTQSIQSVINKVSNSGGGIVVVPEGKFLTGSLIIKSGVTIKLEDKAVLLGSLNPFDYIINNTFRHFINAEGASNIGIIGEGTIDGQGRELALAIDSMYYAGSWDDPGYNTRRLRPGNRPKLLHFAQSDHILLDGIAVKNAANWVMDFDRCDSLTINKVTVDSDAYWNNDGMDIGDCSNVRITNCFVNAADDGICLKSHHTGVMNENIYIANCTVRSSASAIKFGTASVGGFKNVKIENIYIYDTFRSAIALESVDGGILENIEISDITANNTGNAIFIKLGHRNADGKIGTLKNISIKNVTVQVPFDVPDRNYEIRGPELPFFHNKFPASITGLPGHYVENVSLENIRIVYPGRSNKGFAYLPINRLKDVPESASEYPEFHMFGELPSWAFYIRHVKGLTMKNMHMSLVEEDFRPAYVFDDVIDLKMDRIIIENMKATEQVVLRNVVNPEIDLSKEKIKKVE